MTDKQTDALRLADALERPGYGWHSTPAQCAAELRRQYAELETLRAGYTAARLEVESLQRRVQEVGAVAKHEHERADRAMRAAQPAGALDEREAFELWARPRGLQLRRNEALGHYGNIDTQRCWEGWQARAPADSVLEDAARWQALPAFFEEYQIDAMKLYRDIDAYLDAARKQGANHDNR